MALKILARLKLQGGKSNPKGTIKSQLKNLYKHALAIYDKGKTNEWKGWIDEIFEFLQDINELSSTTNLKNFTKQQISEVYKTLFEKSGNSIIQNWCKEKSIAYPIPEDVLNDYKQKMKKLFEFYHKNFEGKSFTLEQVEDLISNLFLN